MARVLLVQRDTLLATALEDSLRDAGHVVAWTEESTSAIDVARREGVDAVVIESATIQAALDTVRAFRALEETHDLPVVMITPETGGPQTRLAALRAGATDVVERPFEPEELLLRIERLAGSASVPALEGDLSTHPLAELVQYIQHTGQDGELAVQAPRGSGRVRFIAGRAVAAQCGELAGNKAMLALLEAEQGRFRFVARDRDATADTFAGSPPLPLVRLLLLSGWLADQLALRRRWLPVTGEPLRLTGNPPPTAEDEFGELPIDEVMEELRRQPGSRLYDLLAEVPAAARQVRLAVAWLIEHGAVERQGEPQEENRAFPTTREIDGAILCDVAVEQLQIAARERGFDGSAPFLLLAESGAWPDLMEVFGSLPKAASTAPFARLGRQLEQRRGGTVTLETEHGRLSLHVQELDGARQLQIGSLVPSCAGMLIWLHAGAAEEAVRAAVERLEEMPGSPSGVLVAGRAKGQELAERLSAVNRRWTTTRHSPRSLLAVLRLLRGRE